MDAPLLSIREISGDELSPVYQWDEIEHPDAYPVMEWDAYLAKYSQPRFCHYGIFKNNQLAACLTVELWSETVYEAHVSSARRALTPTEMQRAVTALKNAVLSQGVTRIFCFIPDYLRAAQRLARACGLRRTKEYLTLMEFKQKPVSLICYEL